MPSFRALLFNIYMYVLTAVTIIVCFPALILPAKLIQKIINIWARWVLAGLRVIAGLSYEIRGNEHIPHGAALYAVKHQSMWETIALLAILHSPAIVLKQELTRIPMYGQFTKKAGMVSVDRNAQAKALRTMISDCRRRLKEGRPVVIFPEGSRSEPGTKLRNKPGVAGLYAELNIACIPVALNSGLYWPRHSLQFRTGTIQIEFLPPIEPGLNRKAFMSELECRIEDTATRLHKAGLATLCEEQTA